MPPRAAAPGAPAVDAVPRSLAIGLPAAVFVLTFAAFIPALTAEFVNYDDDKLFLDIDAYRGFGTKQLAWMFTTQYMGHYQPLTWLSAAVDHAISGTRPVSFHTGNVLLHAMNGVLVYLLALHLLTMARVTRVRAKARSFAAATAALAFAVHPLRVESVAWASERRDVLSLFFLLAALLAYLRAVRPASGDAGGGSRGTEPRRRSRRSRAAPSHFVVWYAASCSLLTLSLLAKAWGMSFFVIALVLNVYPLRRLPSAASGWFRSSALRVWIEVTPFAALGLAAAIVAARAQHQALGTLKTLDEWGIAERLVQAAYGLTFYIGKTVWPSRLAALYELPDQLEPTQWRYMFAIPFVLLGTVAVVVFRRIPGLVGTVIVYVVLLMPVLGFLQSGPQLVADKYSYVSCIGWAILAGGALLHVWDSLRRPSDGRLPLGALHAAPIVSVLTILFVLTYRQAAVWHDSETLWTHAIAVGHPSSIAHNNLGKLARQRGELDRAIGHYESAVAIRPTDGAAWFNLANARKAESAYGPAEDAYRRAIPNMPQAQSAYLNLGNLYYNNLRRVDAAIEAYRAGVEFMERNPGKLMTPRLYLALGIALRSRGETDEALITFRKAARYAQTRSRAQQELGRMGGR